MIANNSDKLAKISMFQSSSIQPKHLHSCNYLESTHSCLQNQHIQNVSVRQRLHGLLLENFELKESVARIQGEMKVGEQQRRELKERLKIVLDEMSVNDKIIQALKSNQTLLTNTIMMQSEELTLLRKELQKVNAINGNLIGHNQNLQAENQLLIEIKQRYASDLTKTRNDYDATKLINERLIKQNQNLSLQMQKLLEQISNMQSQLQTRRNDIQQYQKFVLQKLSNVKDTQQFHEQCQAKLQALHTKYSKYKHKACMYKRQRDQLLFHLQHLSRQIDSNSLRKYYSEIQ